MHGRQERSEIVGAYSVCAHPRPPARSPSCRPDQRLAPPPCLTGRRQGDPEDLRAALTIPAYATRSIVSIRVVSKRNGASKGHHAQPHRVVTHQGCPLVDRRRPRCRGVAPWVADFDGAHTPHSTVRSSRLGKLFRHRRHETRTVSAVSARTTPRASAPGVRAIRKRTPKTK